MTAEGHYSHVDGLKVPYNSPHVPHIQYGGLPAAACMNSANCFATYLALGCQLNDLLLTKKLAFAQLRYTCIADCSLLLCQHLCKRHLPVLCFDWLSGIHCVCASMQALNGLNPCP
jgi:hypothetical protein